MSKRSCRWILGTALLSAAGVLVAHAADPAVPARPADASPDAPAQPPLVALRKRPYFTDESIPLRVRGWDAADPAAGELTLQALGSDGSRLRAVFQPIARALSPDDKIDPSGPTLSPWLLRPGRYGLDATAGALASQGRFELLSGIRRSTFGVIDAGFDGSVTGIAPRGEDGLGFNLLFPFADRPGASTAWTTSTQAMIADVAPGGGIRAGLWLPPISDPLRRSAMLADGSASKSGGSLSPVFQYELSRARDLDRPAVCLPAASPRDPGAWQLERNLAFMTGSQAVAAAPLLEQPAAAEPAVSVSLLETVTASNKLAARLGTIFTTMPATRSPIALLVPPIAAEADDRRALLLWLAAQMTQQRVDIVTPTDLLDGSVLRHHRALIVAAAALPDARIAAALTRYAQAGGAVLVPDDAAANIAGAVKLGAAIDQSHFATLDRLIVEGRAQEVARLRRPAQLLRTAEPLARALRGKLDALHLGPAMTVDSPTVFTALHGYGDVQYHFVVNATPDEAAAGPLAIKPVTVTLSLPAAGGPLYDAISGGQASMSAIDGSKMTGSLRLGAGQMRVFARTARPIAAVQVLPPQIVSNYKSEQAPIRLELSASVVDSEGTALNGAFPLRVRVIDAIGVVRYDLWRATERGVLHLNLPLAANDSAGGWTVTVQELVGGKRGDAGFDYRPPAQIGAVAELATGFDPVRGRLLRERPSATSITPANKSTRPREASTAWRAAMPDRVVSIRVEQQKLAVFSHDGTVTRLGGSGQVVSQDVAPVIASPRPPEPLPQSIVSNVLKDRAVKRSVTDRGLTAVGYWGGMVQIFGPDGAARTEQILPSGVADMLWFDGKLIIGLADGEVLALTVE